MRERDSGVVLNFSRLRYFTESRHDSSDESALGQNPRRTTYFTLMPRVKQAVKKALVDKIAEALIELPGIEGS